MAPNSLRNVVRHFAAALLLIASALPGPALADDWPQFQGPRGDGSSAETGLLRAWPADGPKVLWKAAIKPGWGCPTVVGDDVYFGCTEEHRGDKESIVCLSARDGSTRWKHTYEVGPYWERNIGWARGGFRSTPCVAGERVFSLGAIGHLHCLDRASGKVLWAQNLWDEWRPSGEKGYVFSPIVAEGKLILWYSDGCSPMSEPVPDSETEFHKRSVLCRALDPTDGKLLWEFREAHRAGRCGEGQTPAVAEFGGEPCVVVTGNAELKALRLADGREVWKFACPEPRTRGTTIPTPLVLKDHIVNIPDLDATHAVVVNRTKLDQPARNAWTANLDIFTPIHQFRHHEGYLYGFAGQIQGASEQAASDSTVNFVCLELTTGKLVWQQPGFKTGVAMTIADGLLFVRSYQTLRLIEATPQGYQELGKITTHEVWKPTLNLLDFIQPVLSNGRLYIRTPEELICYQVKE